MAATLDDIRRWLEEAPKGTTHVVIVCDTYEYEDHPVYVKPTENVHEVAKANDGPNMTRLMEVYSLTDKHTIVEQLHAGGRVFNYD